MNHSQESFSDDSVSQLLTDYNRIDKSRQPNLNDLIQGNRRLQYRDSVSSAGSSSTLSRTSTINSMENYKRNSIKFSGRRNKTMDTNSSLERVRSQHTHSNPYSTFSADFNATLPTTENHKPNEYANQDEWLQPDYPLHQFSNPASPLQSPVPYINTAYFQQEYSYPRNYMPDTPPLTNNVYPRGHIIKSDPLPNIKPTDITGRHYVVATMAMTGYSQAELVDLLFDYKDTEPIKAKVDCERTMPWNIDHNSSILTLSQTVLEEEKDITKNHLFHLGRRLGITSILLFLPLESFDTAYKLIDNLVVALRSDFCTKEDQSWWKRLILVMNYASEDNEYTYLRSRFFDTFIPQLQQHYKLDHPISVVFISTRIYNSIQETEHRQLYKVYSQRILWQMMEDHMYSGRWCETSIANNMDNDDYVDDYESEEEEELYKTVTVVQNGVVQKNIHPENTHTPVTHYSSPVGTAVQRRATQRYQRLNTDESASALPVIVKRPF